LRKANKLGEWENEPDRLEFEHAGFKCLILRNSELKHLCGYVGLPKWHPYYGWDYDEIDVDVHGGLTFSARGRGKRWKKGYWWIGFDCGHAGDLVPVVESFTQDAKWFRGLIYRNIEYVKAELKHLAEQLTIEKIAERRFEDNG